MRRRYRGDSGSALFAIFGGLVAWHARVDVRVAWHLALENVNLRACARAADWAALPDGDALEVDLLIILCARS